MKTAIGILSVMAALWAAGALYGVHASPWAYAGPVAIGLAPLLLMARRQIPPRTPEEARRAGRVVGLATAGEAIAIVAGIQWLGRAGRPDLIVPLIAAAVGLHFLPLARWLPNRRYYATALALIAAAAAGLLLPPGLRIPAVAGAASAILWLTAMAMLLALPALAAAPD